MSGQVYIITVTGEMDEQLRDEFEDLEVSVDRGVTHLRAVSPDPSMLHGVLNRVEAFGLELLDVRAVRDAAP